MPELPTWLAIGLVVAAGVAVLDLRRAEAETLVVYTTPALADLFAGALSPGFLAAEGARVEPVYVTAGQQYNRLRMSGEHPEADVFVHASPWYLEKGFDEGRFVPIRIEAAERAEARFLGREVDGGRIWYSFAWTPLLEVYPRSFTAPPDLATADVRMGLAHPLLSNNGVYDVVFFESLDPEAGRRAVERATVQPVNARQSINGVADGSFDLTLGYEAVTLFYQAKGADVASSLPVLHGEERLLPVVASVGLVADHDNPAAASFLAYLFSEETQDALARHHWRPVLPGHAEPDGARDVVGLDPVLFDWSDWERLEAALPKYEVRT